MNKIKTIGILSIILLTTQLAYSQSFDEWFRQKKTQIRYLQQQIVALQLQIIELKKGYDILNDGWQTIKGFTHGEFQLHTDHINALDHMSHSIDDDPDNTIREIKQNIRNSY